MFDFVPWNRCKICSTPNAREIVDGQLDSGTELRVISAKLALLDPPVFIDKSSIFRHSKKCYSVRERALRRKKEFDRSKADARLRVIWPDDSPAIGGPHDVLVFVEFEELVQRNPARQAPEEIPAAEETVPEKPSLIEKVKNFFHHKASPGLTVEAHPDPPGPAAPEPCQHKTAWQEIPGGSKKCVDCGYQPPVFVPANSQSRTQYFSRARRFGKFG